MKTTQRGWMLAVCASFLFALGVQAMGQEGGGGEGDKGKSGEAKKEKLMNQRELAEILVRKLGLFRLLPGNPNPLDCMILLSQFGIYPSISSVPTEANPTPGWSLDPEKIVTLEDFAIIMVRALGLTSTVEGDINDPQNWLNALEKAEVQVTNVPGEIGTLVPLASIPMMQPIFEITGDPITLRYVPDSIVGVINTIKFPELPPTAPTPGEEGPKPKPVTPT